jgi:MFS family permease
MNSSTPSTTSVRLQIVWVSVLMALGLYLTRNSLGEIVKSESFLKDSALVQASSTRFSVELTDGIENEQVRSWLRSRQPPGDKPLDFERIKLPYMVADQLRSDQADALVSELESQGAQGFRRISKNQIGSVLGAFFFSYALFQVPAGWFSDRLGARRMLTLYILVWSLLTWMTGWVGSLYGLMFARFFFGFAQSGAYPTSSAIVRRWFPVSSRGRASGLIAFGGRLGGALAPFLTTLLILQLGSWRTVLSVYGLLGIAIAGAYYWIVRDRPSEHPACNRSEQELIGQIPDDAKPELRDIAKMIGLYCGSRSLWLNSLGQFCVNIGWAFLVTWLPTYLKETHKVSEQQGAFMVTLVLATGMLGQLLGGRATDWSVKRFGLRKGRVFPIAVANCIAGCSYLGCLMIDSVWGVVICCAIVSLMTDFANPSIWAFMQDVGGRNTGAIFGWANMWGNFGASVSSKVVPLLLAYGSSSGSGQSLVFITCACAFFIAGCAALGMDATKPLQTSSTPAA